MQFHQSSEERKRDSIINHIFKTFSGQTMGEGEFTLENMIKSIPYNHTNAEDKNESVDGDTVEGEPDSLSLSGQENEVVFSDNLDDPHNDDNDNDDDDEGDDEQDPSPVQPPSEKVKKKRKPAPMINFIFWRMQPEIMLKIDTHAKENNIAKKTIAAGDLWKSISAEEKQEWKDKSRAQFEQKS